MSRAFEDLINECDENFTFYTPYLREVYNEKTNNSIENLIKKYEFYFVTTILELSVTLKNLVRTNHDWEKIFFIKNSFLIIYESSLHFVNLTKGDNVRNYMKHRKISQNSIVAFTEKLNEFTENKEYKFIESVRNIAGAHMHDNINEYYKTIYILDGEAGATLALKYLKILQDGFNVINQLRKR